MVKYRGAQAIHIQPRALCFYQNLKYQQVYSDKPLSGAGSPSCRLGSIQ